MEFSSIMAVLKYLFMGIFVLFFVLDIKSEKSYRIQCYISVTVVLIFSVIGWHWSTGYKVGFIILFVLLTVKTIVDERKRWSDKENDEIEI